ncbi:PAS domain-containing sensor histidine kinase [Microvirga roseola]|uniref:PAS domain-containing sensor histidine kinase n=1 Tax=Microvirga roseola TaxID=2883126 RepID=UPI001E49A6E0|nr:PAS domain-containing sensor histidine kinase [Microvirga roseola]
MTDAPNRYEAMIARLAADPGMAGVVRPGSGVLVWDRAVERLLWASPAAEGLREAFADASGCLVAEFKARERLKELSAGLAPREGTRLERLRLDPARPWLPVTCACRLVGLGEGEVVLVTALVGPVPKSASRARLAPTEGEIADAQMSAAAEIASPQDKPSGTIRFTWQTDASTRFTHVSPALAQAVGPRSSSIVGLTWDEVVRSVAEDPEGIVAGLFARRETWSGCSLLWKADSPLRQVPVEWAGMPVFGAHRELTGFRGFGVLRLDEARELASPADSREGAGSEASSPDDDQWFTHLRDKVAEALSGNRPDEVPAEPSERPRPAASSGLSQTERNAFREIARALGARFEDGGSPQREPSPEGATPEQGVAPPLQPAEIFHGAPVLDRLPIGILIHRGDAILFANRFLLNLAGFEAVEQVRAAGGLKRLFRAMPAPAEEDVLLTLSTRQDETVPVSARLSSAEWNGEPASLMIVRKSLGSDAGQRQSEGRIHELEAILDTATDGVIVLDETGRILSLNRSAEALFGYDERQVVGDAITVLLAPESHMVALDYLDGLRSPGMASLLNDGREVLGRVRQGGTIPLFMTMGRMNDGPGRKFCAVLRDITSFKKAEGELVGARRAAEEASAQKSDLLAKISHEIRTPLNAIIGFAEVMLEERFGPIGNERYKEYLKDVHASGAHVISLVNDLLDLAKVEAGRLELSFIGVNLNDLVSSCVALLQPQAARERIVMRTSFAAKLPPVMADERSMRQIVLNLVSNAIKFTDAGGQVIVSTALTDRGEVAFRVRDTGIGMTEQEVEAALEPFRQIATARRRGGTGLGLPLTKALVEANRGALQIASHPNEGTLVEVIFPPTRVLAE